MKQITRTISSLQIQRNPEILPTTIHKFAQQVSSSISPNDKKQWVCTLKRNKKLLLVKRTMLLSEILQHSAYQTLKLYFHFSQYQLFVCIAQVNGLIIQQMVLEVQRKELLNHKVIQFLSKKYPGINKYMNIDIKLSKEIQKNSINQFQIKLSPKITYDRNNIAQILEVSFVQLKNQIRTKYIEQMQCPITLSIFQLPVQAQCHHVFDCHALRKWIKIKNTCPYCKFEKIDRVIISKKYLRRLINLHYL